MVLLSALTPASHAQSATNGQVDEIVVTATRRPTAADDVSSPVSIIRGDAVAQHGLVTDALAGTSGVFLQQTTPGQGAAIVRGLKGSAVLHLVDGMRLNNAIFRSAPTQYLALVPTQAVERIELLRGTPASLYGSDAVGGVVQVITRTPSFDSDSLQTRGENVLLLDSADLTRAVRSTLDFGTRTAAASVSAQWQRTGTRRTGAGVRLPFGEYDSKGARAVLALTPSDRRTWRIDVQAVEQPATPRVDQLVAGFGQAEPDASEFLFAPNRRLFGHVGLTQLDGPLGLDWQVDAGWQRIDDDRISRNFNADERRRERNRSDLAGLTASASRSDGQLDWIVGAELYHDRVSSSRVGESITSGVETTLAPRFPDGASVAQGAVYANANRMFGERYTLHAGLRATRVRVELPDAGDGDFAINDLSGDIGWLWHIDDAWTAVANVGAGFRAPNIFDLGTLGERPGNRFNTPNTRLDAEHVLHTDVGIRYRRGGLSGSLTAFRLRYDDRITSVLTGDVTADGRDIVQSVNAASAEVRGIEFTLAADVTPTIGASLMVNATRGEQRIAGSPTEPSDRVPPLNGRLQLSYDAGASRFVGRLDFADRQDRLSDSDIGDSRIDPDGTPGWVLVGIEWQRSFGDSWRLAASAENLLDQRYRAHGSGLDGRGRGISLRVSHEWQ